MFIKKDHEVYPIFKKIYRIFKETSKKIVLKSGTVMRRVIDLNENNGLDIIYKETLDEGFMSENLSGPVYLLMMSDSIGNAKGVIAYSDVDKKVYILDGQYKNINNEILSSGIDEVGSIIEKFLNAIYSEDTQLGKREKANDEILEIRTDMLLFAKNIQKDLSFINFRLLFYAYLNDDYTYKILVKMILWPDLPCPILAQDDESEFDPDSVDERAKLLKQIRSYFLNDFIEKQINPESATRKYVNSAADRDGLLTIEYRREEDKTYYRMDEKLKEEFEYTIYDTTRAKDQFPELSDKEKFRKNCRGEIYRLGLEIVKNFDKTKETFEEDASHIKLPSFSLILKENNMSEMDKNAKDSFDLNIVFDSTRDEEDDNLVDSIFHMTTINILKYLDINDFHNLKAHIKGCFSGDKDNPVDENSIYFSIVVKKFSHGRYDDTFAEKFTLFRHEA